MFLVFRFLSFFELLLIGFLEIIVYWLRFYLSLLNWFGFFFFNVKLFIFNLRIYVNKSIFFIRLLVDTIY